MMKGNMRPIVWADEPAEWPAFPEWMSFYRLLEIERCPRRAALRTANYPDLWGRHGYPPKLHLSNLLGQVVHSCVRTIGTNLANNGCLSALDGRVASLLARWGGLTQLIQKSLELVLSEQSTNPRGIASRQALHQALERRIPFMREQVQIMLSRLQLAASFSGRRDKSRRPILDSKAIRTYTELELRSPTLHWVGVADHVTVGDDQCEIIDFKTGEPDDEHEFQIRIYALLWASDQDANPTRVLADKLTLSYGRRSIDVPAPNENELKKLTENLADRTKAARDFMRAQPPQTKPSPENCTFCDVRHLCSTYWTQETHRRLSEHSSPARGHTDLQLRAISHSGMKSWKGIVGSSPTLPPDTPVILRTSFFDSSVDDALSANPDKELRLLDVRVSNAPTDGSPAILTASDRTEGFLLR
jgi:CRISPR/Cas system-associated exonuclease Cas4 (RecB family)